MKKRNKTIIRILAAVLAANLWFANASVIYAGEVSTLEEAEDNEITFWTHGISPKITMGEEVTLTPVIKDMKDNLIEDTSEFTFKWYKRVYDADGKIVSTEDIAETGASYTFKPEESDITNEYKQTVEFWCETTLGDQTNSCYFLIYDKAKIFNFDPQYIDAVAGSTVTLTPIILDWENKKVDINDQKFSYKWYKAEGMADNRTDLNTTTPTYTFAPIREEDMADVMDWDICYICELYLNGEKVAEGSHYIFPLAECVEHKYVTTITEASPEWDGLILKKCSVCGDMVTTTFAGPKTLTLSKTSYVYNGKVQKPSVTVYTSDGKKLSSSNYKTTYSSGCKNVGRYTVRVDFKGNYCGTLTKTYDIVPKGTTISKVTAGKKSFTASWKKQSSQTTGYQVQYSTDKKFKTGVRTTTIGKTGTVSKKVTGLKAKKTYYVRVRTYKTVKVNGKNVQLSSGWSGAKSVKTK